MLTRADNAGVNILASEEYSDRTEEKEATTLLNPACAWQSSEQGMGERIAPNTNKLKMGRVLECTRGAVEDSESEETEGERGRERERRE